MVHKIKDFNFWINNLVKQIIFHEIPILSYFVFLENGKYNGFGF